jgi:DNA-directed RNA polymerase subunit RPC12/RpoP
MLRNLLKRNNEKIGDFTNCKRCKKNVLVSEIRVDKTGREYICKDCYDLQESATREAVPTKETFIKKTADTGYVCTRCKYKFKRYNLDDPRKKCPFCGREGSVERVKSADQILKESERF